LATLGWLAWRVNQRGSATFTTGVTTVLPPESYFYVVRAADDQVGVASISIDTLKDGIEITEQLGLDLPIQLSSSRSQYTSQYTVGNDLQLRQFRLTLPAPGGPVVQQGTNEGDSIMVVTPGTGEPSRRVPIHPGALIPPLLAAVSLAQQQKLRTGQHGQVLLFDPATMSEGAVNLIVIADSVFTVADSADYDASSATWEPVHLDTVRAWKLTRDDGVRPETVWVDARGLPIQTHSIGGLSLDRSAFEIVTINYRRRPEPHQIDRPGSAVPRSTIASTVTPEPGVRGMQVLASVTGEPWLAPSDSSDVQLLAGDTIVTTVASWDSAAVGFELPSSDRSLAKWISDGPLFGTTNHLIVDQARSVVAGETDPALAAARLVRWVSQNIKQSPQQVVPLAATVLRTRRGDVDGHTVLFVALARAAGLPARTVSGLLLAGERFYFHSWAQVYLGRWVPVDPTSGSFPADAGRIQISVGGLSRPTDLLPLVASVDFRLVSVNRQP
jgi:transglutaminase-like putative cysteine protease